MATSIRETGYTALMMQEAVDAEVSEISNAAKSKESIASIAHKLVEEHSHESKTFDQAMDNILGHIDFDPDGGVCNLMQSGDLRSSQAGKLMLIDKGISGKITGTILLLRIVINLHAIMLGALHQIMYTIVCWHYVSSEALDFLPLQISHCGHYQQRLAQKISLPVPEITLAVASVEFSWGVALLLGALYHIVKFLRKKISLSSTETVVPEQMSKKKVMESYDKYQHLAKLVWDNMQELASFSALKMLGLVHPGVIGHYAKDHCISAERAALALVKNYLRVSGDEHPDFKHLTSNQVRYLGILQLDRLQLALDEVSHTSNAQKVVSGNLHSSFYKLLIQLKEEEANLKEKASGTIPRQDEVADDVLSKVWRVHVVAVMEASMFWLSSLFFFVCGAAAFTLKLITVAVNILNPDVNAGATVLEVLGFLNQVLGIMQVQKLLRWRLFRFIFGGQDAEISIEEKLVEQVYEARLAQAIWSLSAMTCFEKVVTLLNLNDDDLQRLMLEEAEHKKNKMIVPLWEAVGKGERHKLKGRFHTYAVKWVKAE